MTNTVISWCLVEVSRYGGDSRGSSCLNWGDITNLLISRLVSCCARHILHVSKLYRICMQHKLFVPLHEISTWDIVSTNIRCSLSHLVSLRPVNHRHLIPTLRHVNLLFTFEYNSRNQLSRFKYHSKANDGTLILFPHVLRCIGLTGFCHGPRTIVLPPIPYHHTRRLPGQLSG